MLADKVVELNLFEMRYFSMLVSKKVAASTGLSPMKMNLDWPSLKQDEAGTWPPANPNWFKQQELMSSLGPFMGMMGGGGGGGGGAPAAAQQAQDAGPAKEEAP